MVLPADGHVHSEWSWDAPRGSMERTCARAVALGMPAVAFTEHADYTTWAALAGDVEEPELRAFLAPDGTVRPPVLDLTGYLEQLQRCRDRFPELRILSGVELGEPHRQSAVAAAFLHAGRFDRVLGSLHCLPVDQRSSELPDLYRQRPAADVVRAYLAELLRLIESPAEFDVLAHVDYPIRYWPAQAGPCDLRTFSEEFRQVLRALAATGRALEVNTRLPLHPDVVRWWREKGGAAVTFGSDAHEPAALAHGFAAAATMVEAHGFRPGRHPYDVWVR